MTSLLVLIFQKPLTCIRNNLILHVYHNVMKIGKKQRTMLAQYRVLQLRCVCVRDVRLPNFAPFYPVY